MDKGYEAYCLADRVFYDSPTRAARDLVGFEFARRPVPEGWQREQLDDWLAYRPMDVKLPPQGWKIHVSACLDNAEQTLAAVWNYCVPRRIAFKFIRGEKLLFLRNLKYAPRGSSGKFVTIYPVDDTHLEVVLTELGALLDGQPGPYILSDLRWGAGPLYVRYGGFAERYRVGEQGEWELAIEDTSGRLVEDRRGTTFEVPSWVSLPEFLQPHLAARNATTVKDLPYRIDRALHFSNGGGVYAGQELRTGERVVLKEARPHAGLAVDRTDAVTRLENERAMLTRLAGLDVVPDLKEHFTLGEHHFLVEEFVDGSTLNALIVERWPMFAHAVEEVPVVEYSDWACSVYDRVAHVVETVHDRGIVIGDLHPKNMIVRPDGQIVLIDLEVAANVGAQSRPALADASFTPPPGCRGVDGDRYALACLKLYLFMPLTALFILDRSKAEELADAIVELFPVDRAFLDDAVRVIVGDGSAASSSRRPRDRQSSTLEPEPDAWWRARDSIAGAILASATPDRDDRLFPGDVRQFLTDGLNLAYGAAGVL
jgi:tRNA A-37 threonylcarbamoyl transferase component Bud32